MSVPVLGIVTGLKSEARILRDLDLACISVGGKAPSAPDRIARLVAGGAAGLVSFGIAGALHPALRAGDVVVADGVVGSNAERWQCHAAWVAALSTPTPRVTPPTDVGLRRRPLRRGPSEGQARADEWVPAQGRDDGRGDGKVGAILGLDRLLGSPQGKAAAFARTGALAIDMESHHVARAAAEYGLPFIAIRAISDRADESLPSCLADFVDADGRTKLSAVLAALIFRRVKLRELIATGRASRRAHQALLGCRGALAGLR